MEKRMGVELGHYLSSNKIYTIFEAYKAILTFRYELQEKQDIINYSVLNL